MLGPWLSGFGLTCDIVGFGLIVLEWIRGYRRTQEDKSDELENMAEPQDDILPSPELSEMENWRRLGFLRWHMRDDWLIEDQARLKPFLWGAGLIVLGFSLQLAGVIVGSYS